MQFTWDMQHQEPVFHYWVLHKTSLIDKSATISSPGACYYRNALACPYGMINWHYYLTN